MLIPGPAPFICRCRCRCDHAKLLTEKLLCLQADGRGKRATPIPSEPRSKTERPFESRFHFPCKAVAMLKHHFFRRYHLRRHNVPDEVGVGVGVRRPLSLGVVRAPLLPVAAADRATRSVFPSRENRFRVCGVGEDGCGRMTPTRQLSHATKRCRRNRDPFER